VFTKERTYQLASFALKIIQLFPEKTFAKPLFTLFIFFPVTLSLLVACAANEKKEGGTSKKNEGITALHENATTYYVSSSGNDANSGTSTTTPWRTIAKINNSTFLPGDFVLFRRGDTWREELIIPSSGLAGKPITFSAYGTGAKPIISGADIVTNWQSAGTNVWSIALAVGRAMIVVDDSIYAETSSLASLSEGKYFIGDGRLYIYSATNPNSHRVEVSKREFCIYSQSKDLRHHVNVVGLEMRYAAGGGFGADGNGTHFPGFITIDSCHFYANRLWGCLTRDGHDNDTFKNSTATYNGNGFYAWISDNCTMTHDSSAHSIVYGNTDGGAFQSYRGSNWLVEYCYSNYDNDAIHIDASGLPCNAIIRYNKVFNSKFGNPNTPGMGVGSVAAGGKVEIYYNLLVNCASAGFECYAPSNGNILFYNNTIYLNNSTGSNGTIYLVYGKNFVFKNNIIVRDYAKDKTLFLIQQPSNMSVNDYNLYYTFNDPGSHFRAYYNGYYNTLATWTIATNQDAHSVNTDPLFVNVASDWRLQTGSPCINAGVDVGLTRDILGNPIVGLPDMGAYEHTNGNSTHKASASNDINLTLHKNSTNFLLSKK
jgi:hypothetical protein